MGGIVAMLMAFLAFVVPLAVPLFVQRWRTFAVVVAAAVAFFAWLTIDIKPGQPHWIGAFLGGLMLLGFGAGAIARFVMLIARLAPTSQTDSSSD